MAHLQVQCKVATWHMVGELVMLAPALLPSSFSLLRPSKQEQAAPLPRSSVNPGEVFGH